MKKILFVINTLGGAGAERALLELLRQLNPEKYQVDLYVLLEQGELIAEVPPQVRLRSRSYCNASVLSAEGKRQLNRRVFGRLFARGAVFRNALYLAENTGKMIKKGRLQADKLLWRVMSDSAPKLQERYDIAVAYLEGGSTYFVHDHVEADRKVAFVHVDYTYAGYSRSLDRDCYLDFDQIFTVSDEVKQAFLNVYPECAAKTALFHNRIDREGIQRKALLPGGFSDTYDGKRILTVGRLTTQKAYEVAIDTMKHLKEQGVRARWYVLGDGTLHARLEQKIRSLGLMEDFILLGAVENPYPYYKQCDLYVHATRFEGKSIAVQEAQILGCAILVSDCSGNREQVVDGVDGERCELDAAKLAKRIRILLQEDELRSRYGKNAAQKILPDQGSIVSLFE